MNTPQLKLASRREVPDATLVSLRQLQEQLPTILQAQKCVAQMTRARYLAMLEEGFTEEQALELCKL